METLDNLFTLGIRMIENFINWVNNSLDDNVSKGEKGIFILIILMLIANLKNWGFKAEIKK